MLRNAVRCNPQGAIAPLSSNGATASGKNRSGLSQSTWTLPYRPLLALYVASLRDTSFNLFHNAAVIQWAKIFCLTQRRSDATIRAKQNLQGPLLTEACHPFDKLQVAWTLDAFGASFSYGLRLVVIAAYQLTPCVTSVNK